MFRRGGWAVFAVLALLVASTGTRAEDKTAKPLTNEDVVKLAKLGLGDDVVVAKIQEAHAVDFKTEVDDLEKLKADGVSAAVIAAMLKRQAGDEAAKPVAVIPPTAGEPSGVGAVTLSTKDKGEIALNSEEGSYSSTYAFVTVLQHFNFPGLKAATRTTDHRPTAIVHSAKDPAGRIWFVRAEPDADDNERSVKMGNMGVFKQKGLNTPDTDKRIACDSVQEGADVWKLTPKKDLKPGEYGLFYSAGVAQTAELYAFGVD